MENAFNINAGSRIGKGEVESSILSGSTSLCPCNQPILHCPTPRCRFFDTQRSANTTSEYGGNPWGLFAVRPDAERSLILDKPNVIEIIESRQSFNPVGPERGRQGGPADCSASSAMVSVDIGVIQWLGRGRSQQCVMCSGK